MNGHATKQSVDLTNCDLEPIHVPGGIQPHGLLLAFDASRLVLCNWSQNAADWLGAEPVAGASFEQMFPDIERSRIDSLLANREGIIHPFILEPSSGGGNKPGRFQAMLHHYRGLLIVELEHAAGLPEGPALLMSLPLRLNLANHHMQACPDLATLYSAIAEEVRSISGFDRVMVYRFLEEGHGAVVGESVDDRFESFLGLHYPATDIPKQARRLYELNPVRAIADILAPPSPILPEARPGSGDALDLSYSCFRAVSPIHIEYLRNMGVRASMSVSILCEGRLWGLIACHHYEPSRLSFEDRAACEILGQMAAVYLTSRDLSEANRQRSDRAEVLAQVTNDLATSEEFFTEAMASAEALCRCVEADGVAFCWRDGPTTWGATPSPDTVEALAETLLASGASVWDTDRLGEHAACDQDDLGSLCGGLALPLESPELTGLLFFRKEYAQEVVWAGDPNKPAEPTPQGVRLSPRLSFAAWKEDVRGRSRSWSAVDLEMAESIRVTLADLVGRRAKQLARLNQQLAQLNSDLDSFAFAASHDLREPLRGLNHTVRFLLEELEHHKTPSIESRCEALTRLTNRMDELVAGLLRLSRAGSGDLKREQVDLAEAATEAAELALGSDYSETLALSAPSGVLLTADYMCFRELLANLISNAVKYNRQSEKRVEISAAPSGSLRTESGRFATVVRVSDNGVGIPQDHHDTAFQLFWRLHTEEHYGDGTGAGLAIVKKIVQRHGGMIWIESEPDRGTTFCFCLEPTIS
ncbi:Phytochrome-like protein cph1 [Pseudobythopirellula maris]|uniref:histidine kinase n=1 Tax=Pseudobythopirellula maris TaxID=2527991 RepID=A0A5C5ZU99_9BACT|nr:ATP-binding protein [Pseudobythopirellula maris]TWT90675.1 Phytochrome-like protein cph1 [Pseudobythopirellula maris]